MYIVIRALISEDSGQANLVHTSNPLYDMLTFIIQVQEWRTCREIYQYVYKVEVFIEYVQQVYMQVLFLILNVMDLR